MPTNTDLVTDLPADFEVFGQAVDTSMADLKGGTTGQILSKTTNADMDFTWIANDQGDITGVTATSPLTGGGTSGAITVGIQDATTSVKGSVQLSDSTSTTSSILAATPTAVKSAYDLAAAAIPKSTVTTAGDVIYATGSSAVTRLGIGTAGQVLTVNGGATAPSWATPTSGGMTSIASGSLPTGATSITLSAIVGTYKNLQLVIRDPYPATATSLALQFNGNTSSVYRYVSSYYGATGPISGTAVDATTSLEISQTSLAATDNNNLFVIDIYDYANAITNKSGRYNSNFQSASYAQFINNASFAFNSTTAITSITIKNASAYNFSGGTYVLYGVN